MAKVHERNRTSSRPSMRDGSQVIKSFVHEAEQRRLASRFARSGKKRLTPQPPRHCRPGHDVANGITEHSSEDDRLETRLGSTVPNQSNLNENDKAAIVAGLFNLQLVGRMRRISLPAAAATPGGDLTHKPIFAFPRRKLQMETVVTNDGNYHSTIGTVTSPTAVAVTTTQHMGQRPRASNLAAKLDTILRSSLWMRRKVVLQPPMPRHGVSTKISAAFPLPVSKPSTPVPLSLSSRPKAPNACSPTQSNEKYSIYRRHYGQCVTSRDMTESRQLLVTILKRWQFPVVRRWRERKERSKQAALHSVNGIAPSSLLVSPVNEVLYRTNDPQSSNVARILNQRLIGDVPALKFFHEEEALAQVSTESDQVSTGRGNAGIPGDMVMPLSLFNGSEGNGSSPQRVTPRGVCYTLDTAGCRRIKMRSDAPLPGNKEGIHPCRLKEQAKPQVMTVERAMSNILRRKMIRRVKSKHQAINRLTNDFERFKSARTAKLGSQLALRHAEGEQMVSKRLVLLHSSDMELPLHMGDQELALARLRVKKANLVAACQTLRVLGAALQYIEMAGEASGLDISTGEQQFLELLRCAVEGDHALTPLLIDGMRRQFDSEQRKKPLIADLLGLLETVEPEMPPPNL